MNSSIQLSPCAGQSDSDVQQYYKSASVGSVAVVRHTQGHMLKYDITEVEGVNPARGRIYIRQFGAFYSKSGKNCFHPKGQTRLVVPTEEVIAWATVHPQGEFGYSIYQNGIEALTGSKFSS